MDFSRAAVVVFAVGAALCVVVAVSVWARRRSGRVSWHGPLIDYRLRASYLGTVGVALALHAGAIALANAGHVHTGFRFEMTSLTIFVLAVFGAGIAEWSARRHTSR